MNHPDTQRDGEKLLRDGWADEDVERFTGLSLPAILLLRAKAAAAPDRIRRDPLMREAPRPR